MTARLRFAEVGEGDLPDLLAISPAGCSDGNAPAPAFWTRLGAIEVERRDDRGAWS